MTCAYSREHPSIKLALIELGKTALSARDLSKRLGMKHVATYRVIEWLRTRGLIHVSCWNTSINPFTRMFVSGPGRDAIRPEWKDGRRRDEKWREKRRVKEKTERAEAKVVEPEKSTCELTEAWR